jgi:basic membrane lipoprotein Med (substrate-binding protein (PBP1-ABC) superfamily)
VAENDYNKALLAPVKAQIAKIRQQIIDGVIKVPDENSDMAAWAKTLK